MDSKINSYEDLEVYQRLCKLHLEIHLSIAYKKKYISEDKFKYFVKEYDDCGKMLNGLRNSLEKYVT